MSLAAFVDRTVAQLRQTSVDAAELPPDTAAGSLFSGAAGVAFFLHEIAGLRTDLTLLPLARRWWTLADACAGRAIPDDWHGLANGFLAGEAGVAYVDALLAAAEGDAARVVKAAGRVERVTSRPWTSAQFRAGDLVGGAGGVACLARDLAARLGATPGHDEACAILARVEVRAIEALEASCAQPIAGDTPLGMAHGIAGEIWVLQRAHGTEAPHVRSRLTELAALRQVDDDGLVHWARTRAEIDLVCSWCAGLAGQSVLWTDTARRSGKEDDLALARSVVASLAALPDRTPGVCCGLAGQALAFQRFADLSGERRFARLAYDRLRRAAGMVETMPDLRLGLWQGALGVALVAARRMRGASSIPLLDPV